MNIRRKRRKDQLKINRALKKNLFKGVIISPCCYCKGVFTIEQLTIEHVIPLSFGGTNDKANIKLACLACNQAKGRESWFLKRQINRQFFESFALA